MKKNKSQSFSYRIFKGNELTEVKSLWSSLEEKIPHRSINTRWDWVETWVTIYKDLVDVSFFVAYKRGVPVGIALLTRETHRPFASSVMTAHIGTNGEPLKDAVRSTPNALLVAREDVSFFLAQLFPYLLMECKYDEIIFDEYTAEEAEAINAYLKKNKIRASIRRFASQQFNLQQARAENTDPLNYLGKNIRHGFRRTLKDFGDDTYIEWAENVDQGIDILNDLVRFYEDKWVRRENRGSMFASPLYTKFHHEIIKKLLPKGEIMLTRLVCDRFGKLACSYYFLVDKTAYGYQVGQRDYVDLPEAGTLNLKKLKIGFVSNILNMRICLRKGFDIYSHTLGDYRYKKELSNEEVEYVTISVKRTIKPYVREAIFNTYEYIDTHKKLSKVLWFVRKVVSK